jgi:hypothetical protein
MLGRVLDAKDKGRKFRFPFWIILPILLLGGAASLIVSDRSPTKAIVIENNVPKQQETVLKNPENKAPLQKTNNNRSVENPSQEKQIAGSLNKPVPSDQIETVVFAADENKLEPNEFPQIQQYYFGLKGLKKKTGYKPASLSSFPSTPSSLSLPPMFSLSEDVLNNDPYMLGNNKIVIPDCPDFSDNKRNWYLEVFGAIDFPSKKLKESIGKSSFLEQKDSTEKIHAFLGLPESGLQNIYPTPGY